MAFFISHFAACLLLVNQHKLFMLRFYSRCNLAFLNSIASRLNKSPIGDQFHLFPPPWKHVCVLFCCTSAFMGTKSVKKPETVCNDVSLVVHKPVKNCCHKGGPICKEICLYSKWQLRQMFKPCTSTCHIAVMWTNLIRLILFFYHKKNKLLDIDLVFPVIFGALSTLLLIVFKGFKFYSVWCFLLL